MVSVDCCDELQKSHNAQFCVCVKPRQTNNCSSFKNCCCCFEVELRRRFWPQQKVDSISISGRSGQNQKHSLQRATLLELTGVAFPPATKKTLFLNQFGFEQHQLVIMVASTTS